MKYAIMSDAHANPRALETAIADARELGCGKFLFLGDVTGYGYDVRTTLELVRKNFDVVLLGNHDAICIGRKSSPFDDINPNYDQDRRQRGQLDAEQLKWLGKKKCMRVRSGMALTHGDFTDPDKWYYIIEAPEAAESLAARREKMMFCGHSHHAEVWELTKDLHLKCPTHQRDMRPAMEAESLVFKRTPGARYLVNVGSVGYPRNDLCSTYAICDPSEDSFTLRRLPFDFERYVFDLKAHDIPFPPWLRELLLLASRSG